MDATILTCPATIAFVIVSSAGIRLPSCALSFTLRIVPLSAAGRTPSAAKL